jgi:tubulin polyglutamylase TTLL6/13
VVCCIMQPYHLFREYYVGRMLNRSCWTTKFFGFPDLCEKVKMARYLSSLAPLLGAASPLLHTAPQTFVLPEEWEQLEEFMNAGSRTVIVKPEGGSQGKGIFITQTLEDIPRAGKAAVVQQYIADPLLLGGLKFDLRVYVIVVGLGAQQRIVVVEEGLARFCVSSQAMYTHSGARLIFS